MNIRKLGSIIRLASIPIRMDIQPGDFWKFKRDYPTMFDGYVELKKHTQDLALAIRDLVRYLEEKDA